MSDGEGFVTASVFHVSHRIVWVIVAIQLPSDHMFLTHLIAMPFTYREIFSCSLILYRRSSIIRKPAKRNVVFAFGGCAWSCCFFSFFLFHISRISWRVFFKPCTSDAWERRVNNNNGDAVNLISTRAWLIYFACNLFGWTLVGREASTREREENLFFRLYRVYFVEVSSNRRKSKFQLNVVQGSQIEFHPKSEGETREATAQQRRRRIWYSMWDCTNLYTFLMKFTVFAVVRKKRIVISSRCVAS